MIIAIWRNLSRLSLGKRSTSSYTFSHEILQRYCKLIVLGTLAMPGYANPKWYFQLVENFCVYLQAKNQLHTPCFSGDIVKICKLLILGTLGMVKPLPQQKKKIASTCRRLQCLSACAAIWLADNILAQKSRTRILPDMGLVWKYQQQY